MTKAEQIVFAQEMFGRLGNGALSFVAGAACIHGVNWLLHEKKVPIDSRGLRDNETALHEAARAGNAKLVEYLISAGAGLNELNRLKATSLMNACIPGKRAAKCALLLVEAGADVKYTRDVAPTTALEAAIERKADPRTIEILTKAVRNAQLVRQAQKPQSGPRD